MEKRCTICSSKHIVKRGKRKRVYGSTQLYQCASCGSCFTDKLQKRTYPTAVIYTALQTYAQGKSLQETSSIVNKTHHVTTSKSTIHFWIHAYAHLTPLVQQRNKIITHKPVILSKRFTHENLKYVYLLHYYKLNTLVQPRFSTLHDFLIRFEQGCPDVFFSVGRRCSQQPSKKEGLIIQRKHNLACVMTEFAVQGARTPLQRHEKVEAFLLMQDTATVACEVPVWYWDKTLNEGVTGHIDILQVRNNLVYILDYKPDAAKQRTAKDQLYHYAVALSLRAHVPLHKIRCAWFDDKTYHEFSPRVMSK